MKSNKFLARRAAAVVAACSAAMAVPMTAALAAFESPPAQNFSGLLGDNTDGAATGVWEMQGTIETAGLAIVLLTITMVGIVFARKVVRKFTG